MSVLSKNFDVDIKKVGDYYDIKLTLFNAFHGVSSDQVKFGSLQTVELSVENSVKNTLLPDENKLYEIIENHINMWMKIGKTVNLWKVQLSPLINKDDHRYNIVADPDGYKIGELGLYKKNII